MRKPWQPEFDIGQRRVHYHASIQCGFCDKRTAAVIATVGLCDEHLAIVREIEAGRVKNYRKAPRVRNVLERDYTIGTVTCRCGTTFSYRQGQQGARSWCDECSAAAGTTHQRKKRLRMLEQQQAAG